MCHHKRKRAKNQRAGCLMCKPHKMNGWIKRRLDVRKGFATLRDKRHSESDLNELE